MYKKYHDQGFELIAFPSNQFGCQAPGTSDEERAYAWRKFQFEFPVMDKVAVKYKGMPQCVDTREGPDPTAVDPMSPVYAFLKQPPYDAEIEWNYVKWLVGRDGRVLRRYSTGDPLKQGLEEDLKAALAGQELPAKRCEVIASINGIVTEERCVLVAADALP